MEELMQAGQIANTNVADAFNETQQQGNKANGVQALQPAGGGQQNAGAPAAADVMVTLSAGGITAALTALANAATAETNIPAGNGNAQAVQQSQVNQNVEAAQAIRAYSNASQAAANNNENMVQNQQAPQQTQKTINRVGGA